MTAASSPIANAERAEVLDALRGFALLGIVITHMPDFSGYSFLSPADRLALDRFGLDAPLATVAEFLIRGKFLSLFALLFGIGFAVQMDSAGRRGANFNRHFIRRLAALFAIGLAHACVWYGDILKDYALLGMLLLLTVRWSMSALVRATAMVLGLRMVWPAIIWAIRIGNVVRMFSRRLAHARIIRRDECVAVARKHDGGRNASPIGLRRNRAARRARPVLKAHQPSRLDAARQRQQPAQSNGVRTGAQCVLHPIAVDRVLDRNSVDSGKGQQDTRFEGRDCLQRRQLHALWRFGHTRMHARRKEREGRDQQHSVRHG